MKSIFTQEGTLNMDTWTPLFRSLLASSVWCATSKETKLVWVTLLALKDQDGIVVGSIPGLAKDAGVSPAECAEALRVLESPDPFSQTKDYDGRRIRTVERGWLVLNHSVFQEKMKEECRKAYKRRWQREARRKAKPKSGGPTATENTFVKIHNEEGAESAELFLEKSQAVAKATREPKKSFKRPAMEEVKLHAEKIGLPDVEAEKFFHHFESNGWKVGGRTPMQSWSSAMAKWKIRYLQDGPIGVAASISRPMDIKTIINAKEQIAVGLKNKHSTEVAMGTTWNDQKAKEDYFKLKKEIKQLNVQLSNMA